MLDLTLLYLLILLWPVPPTTQLSLPTTSFIPHILRPNPTAPANLSLADLFNGYPPSPYIYHIPDSSHRSVTFSAYRNRLNTTGTDIVLEIAATDAHAHRPNQAMGEAKRRYAEAISSDQVNMVLDPTAYTTWDDWVVTIAAIQVLVRRWGPVECIFATEYGGSPRRYLGVGNIYGSHYY